MSSSRSQSETALVSALEEAEFVILEASLGREEEYWSWLRLDHASYPGCEAHAFTLSQAVTWGATLDSNGDILLICDAGPGTDEDHHPRLLLESRWDALCSVTRDLGALLTSYRVWIEQGHMPGVVWGSGAQTWFRTMWPASNIERPRISDFIDYVDELIRPHVVRLNELGFWTKESCSGLVEDHPDRQPYWPYVMFEERTYPWASAHLFTLADLAGWIPTYAPHNFDIYVRAREKEDLYDSWIRLVDCAEYLESLLRPYRGIVNFDYGSDGAEYKTTLPSSGR